MKKTTLIVTAILVILISMVKIYGQKEEKTEDFNVDRFTTEEPSKSGEASGTDSETGEEITDTFIRAFICGEVEKPQVITLPEGSRIIDFVDASGGFTEDAAMEYVNLAAIVNDGDRIYIPSLEEVKDTDANDWLDDNNEPGTSSDGKVNINVADVNGLMNLPGIGESKAKAIVNYREEHGKYEDIKDILNVSGIGNSTFANIKDYITVK